VKHVVRSACPDADLVAVGVLRDPEFVLGGEDRHPHRLLAFVAYVVRPVGAGREADDIAGFEQLLAFRGAESRSACDRDQPLFVGPLEVVRADRLAGWQVIDAHTDSRGTEFWPEPGRSTEVARRLGAVGRDVGLAAEEVERLHCESMRATRWPSLGRRR
jgi:hypothetical protein